MTYEKAIDVLKNYDNWLNGDPRRRMPKTSDLQQAIQLAIRVLYMVDAGELPSSPTQLRFDVIMKTIQDFINENKTDNENN